jgi:tetratricopeptide (TPR) repeat protein
MRADLVGLGVRLKWVAADEREEPALAAVMERLRLEGSGILLIYDNAIDAEALRPYLPRGGAARVLVTSNAHTWRGVAEPVEIRLWPKEIGADYLIARTGRGAERAAAEALSVALGGLPLAHEQAAAYCERLDMSLADYHQRFDATPAKFLDDSRHAPAEYHDGLTVAKTFALAIEKAAKLHPAAEPLIVHAALLAPEPIPLFLFSEGREKFGERLATALVGDGLIEAIAALRAFALVDRETITDERDPTITTDCIRLHRLVRQVASARRDDATRDEVRRALIEATTTLYPENVFDDPQTWPRARRLDALALALVASDAVAPGVQASAASLLDRAGGYRHGALAAYAQARPLRERALTIRERALGPEHPDTAESLNNLGLLLQDQGDHAGARPLLERALAIGEKVLGPEHPDTWARVNNLASVRQAQGDFAAARSLRERALTISEKVFGPEDHRTAMSLNNLAFLLRQQGEIAAARPLFERALTIDEKMLGREHPHTAIALNNLALVLQEQGDLLGAQALFERSLTIHEKVLGPEHPNTAYSFNNLGGLLRDKGDLTAARSFYERALAIREKVLGPEHPDTALSLHHLANLRQKLNDLAAAHPLYERALAIWYKVLGPEHPNTNLGRRNFATLLLASGRPGDALTLGQVALAAHDKVLGRDHPWTKGSARVTADALDALGRGDEAKALREKYGIAGEDVKKT